MVVKTKTADISLVSREELGEIIAKIKHGKNNKKRPRSAKSAIWRIFLELNNVRRALSNMNLTSIEASMF